MLRERTAGGVSYRNQGVVVGYGTLLEVARGEQARREQRASERLARKALLIAIAAAAITTIISAASLVVAFTDETADRVVEVRDGLPVDAGARDTMLLRSIDAQLAEQSRDVDELLRVLTRALRRPRG